jgi:mRNA interferase YafQ
MIKRHKSFINDFKKAKLGDKQFEKFIFYIGLLSNGNNLPKEARDYKLQGDYKGCNEFHLGGDMLIVYLVQNDTITLIRIGTHSQLF